MEYLKCDALGCSHVELVDKVYEKYINMPCPVCGENLLTQEDYDDYLKVKEKYQILIDLGFIKPATTEYINSGLPVISINAHNGKINITADNK